MLGGNCSLAAGVALGNESTAFVAFAAGLAFVDAIIICGNTLVILAVLTSEQLRSVTSLLITSLAVADLLVGVLVLPFSIAHEVLGHVWVFGAVWCQIWLAMDVWMCTASIYNLVVISIERYVAILKPLHYPLIVTTRRGRLAVLGAWMLSFSISFPPMVFNWSEAFSQSAGCECSPLDNSPGYIAYSSTGSFFLPMIIIIFVYIRIYGVVRRIAAEDAALAVEMRETTPMVTEERKVSSTNSRVLINHNAEDDDERERQLSIDSLESHTRFTLPVRLPPDLDDGVHSNGRVLVSVEPNGSAAVRTPPNAPRREKRQNGSHGTLKSFNSGLSLRERFGFGPAARSKPDETTSIRAHGQSKRQARMSAELKAVKMVAVVTGVFIACWLGFSLIYVLRAMPFCKDRPDCIPDTVFSVFFWLGYTNSALNPVLYAVFNRQFRRAFRKLLTCSTGY